MTDSCRISRWVWILAAVSVGVAPTGRAAQPPTQVPPLEVPARVRLDPPPSMASIAFDSHGARLNGLIYKAAGAGPHPVAVFLHGFPGNEKNLDLAQAVRRAGWDVIYFDYRGSWGSGGTFSFAASIADVETVLNWIQTPRHAAEHHFDPNRVAVVGHSFGGWLALLTARRLPPQACVAVMAAWNLGWLAQNADKNPADWSLLQDDFRDTTDPVGGPIRSTSTALLAEVVAAPREWNYLSQARALAERPLLLISATRDSPDGDPAMHERLAAAVRRSDGGDVRHVTFEDDHAFSASRLPLGELLVDWLNGGCARRQSAPPAR